MTCNHVTAEAFMDPWCVVRLVTGDEVLFGFAMRHPATGGLSWLRSTSVRQLDEQLGRATTASGQQYELGRRIQPDDLPLEGLEAWIAYDLLIGPHAEDDEAVPPISVDKDRDAAWVSACKMARHLNIAAPDHMPGMVQEFVKHNLRAYLEMQAQRGRN